MPRGQGAAWHIVRKLPSRETLVRWRWKQLELAMTERFFVKLGWWLFVVSACLFIWAGWRAGDWISLAGGLAFLGANISFMIPVYRTLK